MEERREEGKKKNFKSTRKLILAKQQYHFYTRRLHPTGHSTSIECYDNESSKNNKKARESNMMTRISTSLKIILTFCFCAYAIGNYKVRKNRTITTTQGFVLPQRLPRRINFGEPSGNQKTITRTSKFESSN